MTNTPFSTTNKWVVAPGQYVLLHFDLLDGKERPSRLGLPDDPSFTWLDNTHALYCGPANTNGSFGFSPFRLYLGVRGWTRTSGIDPRKLPGYRLWHFGIISHEDFRQTAEQQARLMTLPGAVAGPDPRIEGARTRAQALVDYLA